MRPQKRLDLLVIASMLFCGTALSFSDLGLDRLFNDVLEAVDDSAGMVISEEAVIEEVIQEEPAPEEEAVVEDVEVVEEPVSEEETVVEDAEVVEEPVTEEEAVVDDAEVVEESVTEEEAVVEDVEIEDVVDGAEVVEELDSEIDNETENKNEKKQDSVAIPPVASEKVIKVVEKKIEETVTNRVFSSEEKLEENRIKEVYANRDEAVKLFLFDYYFSGQFSSQFQSLDTKLYYFNPSMIEGAFEENFFGFYSDLLSSNLDVEKFRRILDVKISDLELRPKDGHFLTYSPLATRIADVGLFYQRRLDVRNLLPKVGQIRGEGNLGHIFADVLGSSEPVVEPVEEEIAEPVPVVEPVEEEIAEPVPVVEPVEEEIAEPVPVVEPVEEEIAEPVPVVEPVEEEIAEPVPVVEPVEEEIAEPVPVVEAVEEEIAEPVPVVEAVEEEIAEPVPVVEPLEEEIAEPVPVVETEVVEKIEYIDSEKIVAPQQNKKNSNGGFYLINESFKVNEFNDVYYLELLFPKDLDLESLSNFTFHLEDEQERNFWPSSIFVSDRQAILIFKSSEVVNSNLLFIRDLVSDAGDKLNGYFSLQVEGDRYTELVKKTDAAYSAYLGDEIEFGVSKLSFGNLHNLVKSSSTIAVEIGNTAALDQECAILVFGNNLKHESQTDEISAKSLTLLSRSSGALPISKPVVDAFKREKKKEFLGFVYFNELERANENSLLYLNLSANGGLEKGRYQTDLSFEVFCP